MSKYSRTTPEEVERIVAMRNAGATYREIAAETGRPLGTIRRHINANPERITYLPNTSTPRGSVFAAMDGMGESERAALIAQAEEYGSTIAEVLAETWLDVYFSEKAKEGAHGRQFKEAG